MEASASSTLSLSCILETCKYKHVLTLDTWWRSSLLTNHSKKTSTVQHEINAYLLHFDSFYFIILHQRSICSTSVICSIHHQLCVPIPSFNISCVALPSFNISYLFQSHHSTSVMCPNPIIQHQKGLSKFYHSTSQVFAPIPSFNISYLSQSHHSTSERWAALSLSFCIRKRHLSLFHHSTSVASVSVQLFNFRDVCPNPNNVHQLSVPVPMFCIREVSIPVPLFYINSVSQYHHQRGASPNPIILWQ